MKKPRKPYKLKKRNDRGGQYAIIDKATGKSEFTATTDKFEAEKLARVQYDQTDNNAAFHQKFAEAHLAKCNSEWLTNTWDMIAKRMIAGPRGKYGGEKKASTRRKEECLWRNSCWDELRHKRAIDTVPRDFEKATASIGVALVTFGQRIHNYAMNHRLIPYAIMGKEMWPKHGSNPRSRAITEDEHNRILKFLGGPNQTLAGLFRSHHMLRNRSRRNEYANWLDFLWFTGASNTDAASMKAENVKWDEGVLEYKRGKWIKPKDHAPVRVAIAKDGEFEKLLKSLPKTGNLFPTLAQIRQSIRSRFFGQIIEALGIPKVTSHGYRFAFAERARKGGMSAEDRMANLGHANYDQTHHYDKNAKVVPVSIEVLDGGLEAA